MEIVTESSFGLQCKVLSEEQWRIGSPLSILKAWLKNLAFVWEAKGKLLKEKKELIYLQLQKHQKQEGHGWTLSKQNQDTNETILKNKDYKYSRVTFFLILYGCHL